MARLLHRVLICAIMVQFILSGMSGIISHVASQADTVARNAHSITSAFCELPIPFKDAICTRTGDVPMSPFNPNVAHFSGWYPFLINEDIHGPAVDLAIRKAANATSTVRALVRGSDLSQWHEISDKLKDFLQRAWACEVTSGTHIALVKTVIDESVIYNPREPCIDNGYFRMSLENDSVFAKLQADLHIGLLPRVVTFKWARRTEHTILEALMIVEDAATTHARHLFTHGDSVYQGLRFLESIALDISSLLALEIVSLKREKDEVVTKLSTTFGMHCGALRNLEGRLSDLGCISDHWREARDLLSLGIYAFNGVRSDLAALSERQAGPKSARLYVLVDQQNQYLKGWVRRLEARRVLMPGQVY